jgi:predicted dithiol-disulfide oxidoreductase (DUF899 family)
VTCQAGPLSSLARAEAWGVGSLARSPRGARFSTPPRATRGGIDMMNVTYHYLDLTPKGRDENGPEGPQAWVRYHDRYED